MIPLLALLKTAALLQVGVIYQQSPGATPPGCDTANMELRRVAARAVVTVSPEKLPEALEKLKGKKDACNTAIRLYLVTLARGQRDAAVSPAIRDLAITDSDTAIRLYALSMVTRDTSDAGIKTLGTALRNGPTMQIRQTALSAFQSRNDAKVSGELQLSYAAISDPSLRMQIVQLVARDTAAWAWLLNVSTRAEENFDIRRTALNAALNPSSRSYYANQYVVQQQRAQRPNDPPTAALVTTYAKLTDSQLRLQVLEVLSRRKDDNAAMEQLGKIAKTDSDYSLRKRAVYGLQAASTKRATEILGEIATQ